MFSDLQKQKLVYDLFLEAIKENLIFKKAKCDEDENPTSSTLKMFQKEYDFCVNIVKSLNL